MNGTYSMAIYTNHSIDGTLIPDVVLENPNMLMLLNEYLQYIDTKKVGAHTTEVIWIPAIEDKELN